MQVAHSPFLAFPDSALLCSAGFIISQMHFSCRKKGVLAATMAAMSGTVCHTPLSSGLSRVISYSGGILTGLTKTERSNKEYMWF